MTKQFYFGILVGGSLALMATLLVSRFGSADAPKTLVRVQSFSYEQQTDPSQASEPLLNGLNEQASVAVKTHSQSVASFEMHAEYARITCNENCAETVLRRFLSGRVLSQAEIDQLSYGSHYAAGLISDDAEMMQAFGSMVLNSGLFNSLQNDAQDAVLRVIQHLPRDQSISFFNQLNIGSEGDRINGVKLLTMLENGDGSMVKYLEDSVQHEVNPNVLAASIEALDSISHGYVSDLTINSISNHLLYHPDPLVKGKALEALSQWQHFDDNVQRYIQQGLNSASFELQRSSLESLDNLLSAEKRNTKNTLSESVQQRIVSIANDPALPADVRIQALSLMNTYM